MGNFFAVGKQGANTTYTNKNACELAEGQECFDITGFDLDVIKIIQVQIPVMIDVIIERPVIDLEGNPVLDENGNQLMEQASAQEQATDENGNLIFETKNELAIDEEKKAAKDAATIFENRIQDKSKNMALGARIIGLVSVLNEDKGLNASQVEAFQAQFAQIQALLQAGSIATAKALIEAVPVDGEIITQDYKDKILGEINKYLT